MKPFDQLTSRGKARRLRKLAINALNQCEFEVADIRLVGVRVNTVFRVRTAGGSSYIIRICKPGWRTIADLSSEIAWLRALSCDTDIGVPEPQPTRNGDFIVRACAEGVPEARHCVVLSWIPGTLLGARLTETNLYKMGVLFARLLMHSHRARETFLSEPGPRSMKHLNAYMQTLQDYVSSTMTYTTTT